MTITVRLFASCAEIAGANQTTVPVDVTSTVRDVRHSLERMFGRELIARSMIAVNAAYANDTDRIADGDEIALIPPVAGG